MNRQQLEHIVRASAAITGADEFVVVGSQAVLGQFPEAPPELLQSMELDLFATRDPLDADLIEGSIGEGSPFHRTFGYYAHGVGEETARLPDGWKARAIRVRTPRMGGATAICPEIHDLLVSKLVAGRAKDLVFIASAIGHGLGTLEALRDRLAETDLDEPIRAVCVERLGRLERA
jgi:hypothetical protein